VVAAVATAAPGLFVNARTDLHWLQVGPPQTRLTETVARLSAYRDAGAAGVFAPGLVALADIAVVATEVGLPLNVLWQPGVAPGVLGRAGVARISTGAPLYRHALVRAVEAARAAATGATPATDGLPYAAVQAPLLP
jgi:2-methylisocitrate lyase-like PEP mutase family enzyme